MSRSYRKPVCKMDNNTFFKKYYNRKLRRKNIVLHSKGAYKKENCRWNICDYNMHLVSKDYIEKYHKGEEYKVIMK